MIITDSTQNKDNTKELKLKRNLKEKKEMTSRLIDIDSHPHQTETTHHLVQAIPFKHYLNILHI